MHAQSSRSAFRLVTLALLAGSALTACHGGGDHGYQDLSYDATVPADLTPGPIDLSGDMDVPAISAPAGTWTWIDLPGTVCDDGSQTGIGVNVGASDKLLVFFNGGGACGDYLSCYGLNTAAHGPYGEAQFMNDVSGLLSGSIVDRSSTSNPFADYTFVFVPYCTGDVHTGVVTRVYTQGSISKTYHHAGHLNALVILDQLAATWPSLSKLVVAGSSAGGFGALFNFDTFASRWSSAESYLLDDSGPILETEWTPDLLESWFMSWDTASWLTGRCPGCSSMSITPLYGAIAGEHPKSRMALLETLQDQTISTYYLLVPTDFQTALEDLATDVLDPLPLFKYFYVAGNTHTMLGNPGQFSTAGTPLLTWLTEFVSDATSWQSLMP